MADRQDFIKFIGSVGIRPSCEVCGENDWLIPDEDAGLFGAVVVHKPGTNMNLPPPMIPAMTMICKKCGNIRLHSYGVIDAFTRSGQGHA